LPKLGMGPIRREQICRAAVAVLAREGYAGTTMRMVAEEAGVSTGMLNHYFSNRQDLLTQALVFVSVRSQLRYAEAMKGLEPGQPRLEALLDSVLGDDAEAQENWRVWVNVHGEAVRLPELRRTIDERLNSWFVLVDQALESLVPPVRDGEVAWSLCLDAVLTGFAILALTSEAELDRQQMRDEVVRIMLAYADARRQPSPPWAGGPRASAAAR
jgi:TetR/AcrR family transcriptional regulator, transcriptional repressor of bet genes